MVLVVRAARPGDARALTRLHVHAGLGTCIGPAWAATHTADLARRLTGGDPDLIAYVAELAGGHGLVCAAVGFVHATLAHPDNPLGRTAHLAVGRR